MGMMIVDSRTNFRDGAWYAEVIDIVGDSYIFRTPFVEHCRAQLLAELTTLRAETTAQLDSSEWMHVAWRGHA